MRISSLLVFASLVAAPVAVSAQTDRPTPMPVAPADAKASADSKDPNRMVCKSMESTGSRLGKKRECRPASEWAALAAEQRRDIERNQALRYKNNN